MGRQRTLYLAIAMVVSLGMVIAAMAFWPKAPETLADADDPRMVERGGEFYGEFCASCHGENLEGQPDWRVRDAAGRLPAPPHDDGGHSWHHTDQVLVGITKLGPAAFVGLDDYESDMPAFENTLSDEEIRAVIAYIKSKWSAPIRARQDASNRRSDAD